MAIVGAFKGLVELYKPKSNILFPANSEIDILDAINAHIKWKVVLRNYVNGKTDEQLDPLHVEGDTKCILGSWLYTSGVLAMGGFYDFHKLMDAHAQFHKCAGKIVRLHHEGKWSEAGLMLEEEYEHHANNIFALLTSLHENMHKNIL